MPIFLELSSIIIFAFYLYHAYRNSQMGFLFLVVIYATIFENMSIVMFAGMEGGYFYYNDFNLYLYKTPLFIALFWSAIIYSAREIIKPLAKNTRQYLFLAPLYILLLDIVLDVVAVRMNLWTWTGFENGQGFYGVPASNYLGWLLVSFSFLLVWEKFFLPNKDSSKQGLRAILYILQPILSFCLFLGIILPLHAIKSYLDLNPAGQYFLASIVLAIFLILANGKLKSPQEKPKFDKFYLFNIRIFLHIFAIFGLLWTGLYREVSLILILSFLIIFDFFIFYRFTTKK